MGYSVLLNPLFKCPTELVDDGSHTLVPMWKTDGALVHGFSLASFLSVAGILSVNQCLKGLSLSLNLSSKKPKQNKAKTPAELHGIDTQKEGKSSPLRKQRNDEGKKWQNEKKKIYCKWPLQLQVIVTGPGKQKQKLLTFSRGSDGICWIVPICHLT